MNDLFPKNPEPDPDFLIYQSEDGKSRVQIRLEDGTAWLTQLQLAMLFETTKQNISLHIQNIFQDGELEESRVVKEFLTTAADGKNYKTRFFSLDAILAIGYRVRSPRGVQFRQKIRQKAKGRRSRHINKPQTLNITKLP